MRKRKMESHQSHVPVFVSPMHCHTLPPPPRSQSFSLFSLFFVTVFPWKLKLISLMKLHSKILVISVELVGCGFNCFSRPVIVHDPRRSIRIGLHALWKDASHRIQVEKRRQCTSCSRLTLFQAINENENEKSELQKIEIVTHT